MPVLIAAFLLGAVVSPPPDDDDDKRSSGRPAAATAKSADDVQGEVGPSTVRKTEAGGDDDDEEGRGQRSSTIVVTAHKLDTARSHIDAALGASIYSLTNDTIENRPGGETGSVSDILAQAPGVTPSGTGLNLRGSPANQVRINNVIVPEAISDPADLLSSRIADTTRLITGTLPAQFGFAPAGVISVTTKNGLYQHGGQGELFAGTDGFVEPAFEWTGSAGATSLFASGEFEHERSRVADARETSAKDRRTGIDGLGFADHVIDENNRVSLIVGGAHERHEIGATSIGPGTDANGDAYGVATYQHSVGGFTLQTSLFAGAGSNEARFAVTAREHRTSWGTQIDAADTLGAANLVRFGLLATRSAARELGLGGDHSSAGRTSIAVYAQDEWKLASTLTCNPGVRVEWLRGFGPAPRLEPRASLVWQSLNGLAAHLGYARYASAPPLGEGANGASLPDERDDYFDGGLQQTLGGLTVGIDAYSRSTRNYIAEHQTIGSAVPAAFAFDRARISGLELSGTYARHGMTAWANLSLSRAKGRTMIAGEGIFDPATIAAASKGFIPLPGDRPITANGGITQRLGKLTLGGDVLFSSGAVRTLVDTDPNGARHSSYALFGLAAVYHTRIARSPADLRLDLTNLTNVHYALGDTTSLAGDWTRRGRPRAITIGIEQAF